MDTELKLTKGRIKNGYYNSKGQLKDVAINVWGDWIEIHRLSDVSNATQSLIIKDPVELALRILEQQDSYRTAHREDLKQYLRSMQHIVNTTEVPEEKEESPEEDDLD
jgi:hypothetical protein